MMPFALAESLADGERQQDDYVLANSLRADDSHAFDAIRLNYLSM